MTRALGAAGGASSGWATSAGAAAIASAKASKLAVDVGRRPAMTFLSVAGRARNSDRRTGACGSGPDAELYGARQPQRLMPPGEKKFGAQERLGRSPVCQGL